MITRNEQGRYLDQVLTEMKKVCNKIVVLDDDSDDGTAELCIDYGCKVFVTEHCLWEGRENELRQMSFTLATREAKDGDWILCLDADEIMTNIEYLPELIDALDNGELKPIQADGIGFPLFDMWDEQQYRDDEYWSAHKRPWVMCIKYDSKKDYKWNEQGLHCGRFPMNASENFVFTTDAAIKHMGWATELDRIKKYQRYMKVDPDGKHGILAQYESILDKYPVLRRFCQ